MRIEKYDLETGEQKLKIHSRYEVPPRCKVENNEPTMTQQQFKDDADVNKILAKFMRTGILESMGPGQYLDVTEAQDYREAVTTIMKAEAAFMQIPAEARKKFDNDPSKFVEFLKTPENRAEAEKLGFLEPVPVDPGPIEVRVVNPETNQ